MHESEKSKWSRSVVSDSSRPRGLQPTRLLHPWDFPGKSTGVGCHCLLQIRVLIHLKVGPKVSRLFSIGRLFSIVKQSFFMIDRDSALWIFLSSPKIILQSQSGIKRTLFQDLNDGICLFLFYCWVFMCVLGFESIFKIYRTILHFWSTLKVVNLKNL